MFTGRPLPSSIRGFRDLRRVGIVHRVVQFDIFAAPEVEAVDDAGRGRDEIEVEFAGQTLLHDFEMQEPEKAAAETEAQRRR